MLAVLLALVAPAGAHECCTQSMHPLHPRTRHSDSRTSPSFSPWSHLFHFFWLGVAGAAFVAPMRVQPPSQQRAVVDMTEMANWSKRAREKGPFKVPGPPANFAGAQWAPHVFLPFPINVKPAAAAVKEILKQEERPAAAAPSAPAPAAGAPPVARTAAGKSTFTVLLKTPDGDKSFEYDPASENYILDAVDELANADEFANLPYACRAGACSACAGKVVSGNVDASACSFLSVDQKAAGWVLTCTAKVKSDCVIETHKEEDLF